jgi:hypothetical protein
MRGLFRRSIAVWFVLGVVGCSQISVVTVTGTSNSETPIPSHVTYAVLPVVEIENDPSFPKYAEIVARQMDARDYRKTSPQTAHLGVFLLYKTREGTSKSAGGMSSASAGASVDYTMTTGSAPVTTGPRMYTHQLVIAVVDFKKSTTTGPLVELWRGETKNIDSSKDLLSIAPLMVEAAFRHFGDTTAPDVRHHFNEEEIRKLQSAK